MRRIVGDKVRIAKGCDHAGEIVTICAICQDARTETVHYNIKEFNDVTYTDDDFADITAEEFLSAAKENADTNSLLNSASYAKNIQPIVQHAQNIIFAKQTDDYISKERVLETIDNVIQSNMIGFGSAIHNMAFGKLRKDLIQAIESLPTDDNNHETE